MARWGVGLLTAGLLLGGYPVPAPAQTTDNVSPTYQSTPEVVKGLLQYKPHQEGIDYTVPTPEEQKGYAAKLIIGEKVGDKTTTGYLLVDSQGRPVRRVFDSKGDKKVDTWSYYKDGVEVYREIDTSFSGKVDQFRWLNNGGSKWGVDLNRDGKIDAWRIISAEEAAQEVYQAVATHDFGRLRALFITEEELRAIKLPDAHTATINKSLTESQKKFEELCKSASSQLSQGKFLNVESAVPQCTPATPKGPAKDLMRFASRAVLFEAPDKKNNEWLQTGEMILVGQAWRLAGNPSLGDPPIDAGIGRGGDKGLDPRAKKWTDELIAHDQNPPAPPPGPCKDPAVVKFNLERVTLVEQIYSNTTDPQQKETWMRQILDNLNTAHQANEGNDAVLKRLQQYKNQIVQNAPGSSLAAYAHYRELWARFSFPLIDPKVDRLKVQHEWLDELAKYVAIYPKGEDAPDALRQLAMNCEFGPKEKQTEAVKYYGMIVKNFPDHPLTPMARGAIRRLELKGQPMELAGPTLQGQAFNVDRLKGKIVAVYYWDSGSKTCVGEFAMLKQMHATYAAKGFEIVTVSLDDTKEAAAAFLSANPLPGIHLFQGTEQSHGLDGPLALQYGIVAVPTVFLVGRDGRVIDHSLQINDLDDAIKKAQ